MTALTRAEVLEARAVASPPDLERRRQWFPMRRLKREARQDAMAACIPPRKEDAPCCQARLDELGRLPLGFCSPGCIRRPAVWRALTQGDTNRGP